MKVLVVGVSGAVGCNLREPKKSGSGDHARPDHGPDMRLAMGVLRRPHPHQAPIPVSMIEPACQGHLGAAAHPLPMKVLPIMTRHRWSTGALRRHPKDQSAPA